MSERVPISACIIAKNESDRIGPCLDSVSFCDEIVVLDSGSTDDTVEICRAAGARVVETDWPGWVAQKNRAVEAAGNDWILSLDADERVDDELRAAIQALQAGALADEAAPRAYAVARKVRYLGRWLRHGGWYPEWRVRLFHRAHARWGGIDPHDHVEVDGKHERIRSGDLEHYTYRSLDDQIAQINLHTQAAAEDLYRRGKRATLLPAIFRSPFHFFRHYVFRLAFLDGWAGFVMSVMRSYYVFLKYVKLWELSRAPAEDTTAESR
jgi:glycosyltransferase involved in cell wall biosynthesis